MLKCIIFTASFVPFCQSPYSDVNSCSRKLSHGDAFDCKLTDCGWHQRIYFFQRTIPAEYVRPASPLFGGKRKIQKKQPIA